MKLKGDLDSIGLPELFKTLADQRATGVLAITCPMGEKHIALQEGSITVFSDKLAERTRLGELLIARGLLTEAQLQETLKYQREVEPRSRVGDCLVKKGFIPEDRIRQSLRFQLEEEIFDLFTWKGASFEFDSDMTISDIASQTSSHNSMTTAVDSEQGFFDPEGLHQITDPQTLIAEATERLPEWQQIQTRLPTPYLCFKLTPKAEEALPRATRITLNIMKLLKEGRTLETTIKRSCLGRFEVCRTIIKALDDGWLFPYPASELRMLASEHRVQKRYLDALNIYRRLLDSVDTEPARLELQQLIDDTVDSILRAKLAGEMPEGMDAFSHKAAAQQYMRRQRIRRLALAAFCLLSFALIVYLMLQQYAPKAQMPEAYRDAIAKSDTAVAAGDFDQAMQIWDDFYKSIRNKESDTAKRVLERLNLLPQQLDNRVETLMQPLEALEKKGLLEDAEAGYLRLQAEYPKSRLVIRMADGLARIKAKRDASLLEALLNKLQTQINEARELIKQKQLSQAKAKLLEVAQAAPAETVARTQAQEALQELTATETRVAALLTKAEAELKQKQGEKALASFEQALGEWPDLPANEKARPASERLKSRLEQAWAALKRAAGAEAEGNLTEAVNILHGIERDYSEFELAAGLKKRILALEEQGTFITRQLELARTVFAGNKTRGRQLYSDLIKQQPSYLANQKIPIPVYVSANPPALLKQDGKEIGVTPQEVTLVMGQATTLSFERQGYQRMERQLSRLLPDDVEIHVRLKRETVRVLELPGAIFAPPRVIGNVLYVLHGTSLSAFDPTGEKKLWSLDNLFDDKAQTRPASNGTGTDELVADKTWWYPRSPPEPFAENALLLALRSRELLQIDPRKPAAKKLLALPVEPVGQAYLDPVSMLSGKSILAVGTADGKVRAYDLAQPAAPLWERPVDPANAPPKGALAAGLAPRGGGNVVALSASGRLVAWSVMDGREMWSLDVKAAVGDNNALPRSPQDHQALLVHSSGAVSIVDLNQRDKVWELPAARPADEVISAVSDARHVYVVTRDGIVRKYPRQSHPAPVWQKPLDGAPQLPLVLGKLLYAVSSFGTVYALSPEDGRVVWDYRPDFKPSQISLHEGLIYLVTQDNRVLIMNAE